MIAGFHPVAETWIAGFPPREKTGSQVFFPKGGDWIACFPTREENGSQVFPREIRLDRMSPPPPPHGRRLDSRISPKGYDWITGFSIK